MADKYGDLSLDIPIPGAAAAAADPLLDTLLSFFKAVINAHGDAAWNAIAPGTGGHVVKSTFAHDPQRQAFKPASTPALFLFRDSVFKAVQIAAEWRVRPSKLVLRWVPFPVYQQERSRRWEPFFNALPSVLDAAVEAGRHPAWVVPGDSDPRALTRGSLLWKYATVHKLEVAREEVRRGEFLIPIEGDREVSVDALDIPIELEERLVRDPATNAELAYVQAAVQVPAPANTPGASPLTVNTIKFTFDPD